MSERPYNRPEHYDRVGVHVLCFATDFLEPVLDDGYYRVDAKVDNGVFTNTEHNEFRIRVLEEANPDTIAHGGLVVLSNVRPRILQQAMLMGLDYMMRQGQFPPEVMIPVGGQATDD